MQDTINVLWQDWNPSTRSGLVRPFLFATVPACHILTRARAARWPVRGLARPAWAPKNDKPAKYRHVSPPTTAASKYKK